MTSQTLTTHAAPRAKTRARVFPVVARFLLGALMLASGLVGLFHLMPPPPANLPEAAVAFNAGMMKSGYMFPLIAGTQALVGALLLANRFVPLALTLLAPFLVCAFGFHLFLVPQGWVPVLILSGLELYLAWSYRAAFAPMLAARQAANLTSPHTKKPVFQ